jgi:hypothetical protein
MQKIRASDVVIWSDEFQFSRGSFTNRNRLPSGDWMTVPVEAGATGLPINRVKIVPLSGRGWRASMCRDIRAAWPGLAADEITEEIMRPYRLLVGLNMACLHVLCDQLGIHAQWVFQSHLDGGHAVPVVSDEPDELVDASERLAMMVEEVGGTTYLSGPSGRNYLDEQPFLDRNITVIYWAHEGENPCAMEWLRTLDRDTVRA